MKPIVLPSSILAAISCVETTLEVLCGEPVRLGDLTLHPGEISRIKRVSQAATRKIQIQGKFCSLGLTNRRNIDFVMRVPIKTLGALWFPDDNPGILQIEKKSWLFFWKAPDEVWIRLVYLPPNVPITWIVGRSYNERRTASGNP